MSKTRTLTKFAEALEDRMAQKPRIWSRAELARVVGVPKATVNVWFTRGIKPHADNVVKVADALGLSRRELLTLAGHNPDNILDANDQVKKVAPPCSDAVFEYLIEGLEHRTWSSEKDRKGTLEYVRELQKRYPDSPKAESAMM